MQNTRIETVVGLFVLLGLAVAAALVVMFSEGSRSSGPSYTVTVAFPNADGIIKNARVLMSGVRIGKVLEEATINDVGDRALVALAITDGFSIREGSKFSIRESGLLGDRYIDVESNPVLTVPKIPAGAIIDGSRTTGIGDLTSSAKPVLEGADTAIQNINRILSQVERDILTTKTKEDIRETIANARSTMARLDRLLAAAEKGQGPLYVLLKDKKAADNIRALLFNMRTRGILFYKDVAAQNPSLSDEASPDKAAPARR